MSPSRRRATGAVRGFVSRVPSRAPRSRFPPRPVPRCVPFPPRHYARALPGRRDGDIAPYRHYTRRISHAHDRTAITLPCPRALSPPHCPWRFATPTARGGSPLAAGTISHLPIPFLFSILAGTPFGKYACCFPAPAFPCFHEAPTPVQTAPRAFPRSPHFP